MLDRCSFSCGKATRKPRNQSMTNTLHSSEALLANNDEVVCATHARLLEMLYRIGFIEEEAKKTSIHLVYTVALLAFIPAKVPSSSICAPITRSRVSVSLKLSKYPRTAIIANCNS